MLENWITRMKKVGAFLLLAALASCSSSQEQSSVLTIGILQTASHPALDQAREGFMQELNAQLDGKVRFVVQNAEGSIAQARSIAQRFHADSHIDGIFAIATPAAQAAASVERQKPIFFAAVTDPEKAGLKQANHCGTSDMINVPNEIELLIDLVPQAKRVAILFNPSEINSVTVKDKMKDELEKRGMQVILVGVSQESEMAMAATSAMQKSDAILTPIDNTVAMALPTLAKISRAHHRPLIVSDNLLVEKGALAARGVDYFQSGEKAAALAVEVFVKGKKPGDLALAQSSSSLAVINQEVLKELGLSMPEKWIGEAIIVNQQAGKKP
ncbi:ABC transporter substrate-binding protein [Candidatus Protochlamydia phocaeensis]|uniref:ABC transporter substrate-binding protein n=1 Tax=Candidatus Protochlamydia phocaeensis TaxID=1414722 RepID=UPI0008380048|nr:ABC transporter substrate-binding protein [Candidatus Protochlamydia phocaeensis]